MEFKSGPNPENTRAMKCLTVSASPWEAACGLDAIDHHCAPALELQSKVPCVKVGQLKNEVT